MNEWMNEWMSEISECMNAWVSEWVSECMSEWYNWRVSGVSCLNLYGILFNFLTISTADNLLWGSCAQHLMKDTLHVHYTNTNMTVK